MDHRHLKRFDLPEPKTEALFGLGRHIDLSQTMLEQTLLADSTVYGFTERAAVAFAKSTDEMLLDAIVKKAKENGITDLYVLNEDFILEAIREKMERKDEKAIIHCRACRHWTPNGRVSDNGDGLKRWGRCPIRRFVVHEDDFCGEGDDGTEH